MFGVLGACTCLQSRGLEVSLAGVRVWPADVDDCVIPEDTATAVDDDVALLSASVAISAVIVLWDVGGVEWRVKVTGVGEVAEEGEISEVDEVLKMTTKLFLVSASLACAQAFRDCAD